MNPLLRHLDEMVERLSAPCVLCAATTHAGGLCSECRADLPGVTRTRCPVCACETATPEVCGRCLKRKPHFDGVHAPYLYRFPVDVMVQRLKFGGVLEIARVLALELARAVKHSPLPDLVCAVPLSDQRLKARGFNQSFEIARHLAASLKLPLVMAGCQRVRDTPAQMGLSLKDRRHNVRDAFRSTHPVQDLRIALVDDVMTSGATLDEVAKTLKRAGAAQVIGWIVARTPEQR